MAKNGLCNALLDEKKLCRLQKQLGQITEHVPNSTQWAARIEDYELTPAHLLDILLIAFGRSQAYQMQPTCDGELPYILVIAEYFLGRAEILEKQNTISKHAVAVARIVGYALMRVCEVVDQLTPSEVGRIRISRLDSAEITRSAATWGNSSTAMSTGINDHAI